MTTMTSSTDRIEKQIDIKAPVARVWRAITDHREFNTWFRARFEGPFEAGRTVRGQCLCTGYEHLVFEIEIGTVSPQTYFSYRWHPYAVEPGVDYSKEPPTLVEFRLEPIAGGTRVRVTESGFDSIPARRRAEALRMNTDGWEKQLGNVEAYVTSS